MAASGSKSTKRTTTAAKKPTRKTTSAKGKAAMESRIREDIVAIIFMAVGAFLIFALFVAAAGKVGVGVSALLKGVFGNIAYALPFALIAYGIWLFARKTKRGEVRSTILIAVIFLMLLLICSGFYLRSGSDPLMGAGFGEVFDLSADGKSGGILGMYIGSFVVSFIGKAGLYIFSIVILLISLLLLFNTPLSPYVQQFGERSGERRAAARERRAAEREEREREEEERSASEESDTEAERRGDIRIEGMDGDGSYMAETASESKAAHSKLARNRANILDAVKNDDIHVTGPIGGLGLDPDYAGESGTGFGLEPSYRGESGLGLDGESDNDEDHRDMADGDPFAESDGEVPLAERAPVQRKNAAPVTAGLVPDTGFGEAEALENYKLPPIDLLNRGPKTVRTENARELNFKAQKLEQTLRDFKVDAKVIKVTVGPTVTRYEVEPDVGVKIQSIKSLEPDLALKLEVKSVRVVPMPGQAVVGIEAYNANTNLVTLREIIDSPEFRDPDSKISFVLGKNISGKRIVADLNDMPHLLIAGTTGSGKSVCINSILLSILYRARPDEVKLILVDPKVVELKSYNDIPHLLVPVVTEPERAATALNYAVTLMNERYKKFAEFNVRNLDGYNERMKKNGTEEDVLPRIVIVIDELSDLMMIAPAKVQESISRLAAMARAAGMHLIVATQQPLASILTSVIKANIPSRIAFSVSSNSASRVILDEAGAERLHGNGDMLFSPVGTREPMRIQGSFVSDSEVHKVTDYIKKEMDPTYSPDIMQAVSGEISGQLVDDEDDVFRDAVEMVVAAKQASVSMIQRRFRIGYNRAARLVDMMEEHGIVAASDGTNKPRKVLMSETQLANFLGTELPPDDEDEPPFDVGDDDE
ncbi:MAG: DNA translocase FtsK [Clostridiales Family XIII bacterium]|jgi:S-DNA-T family DNA segregation ATPase FtsK/SpoIIIE|nr:DNA translocase FtsK [Clostridiales Family XIII bacterium]